MAGEAPQIVSSTNELAANFTEIRVAHRMNLQQMDQLFGTLSKKTAEYRDLWKKEQSKNIASQAAALQLYEEVERMKLANTQLVKRLEYVEKKMLLGERKRIEMRRKLRNILAESELGYETEP